MALLGWRGNLARIARDPLGYLVHLHRTYGDLAALVRGGTGPTFSAGAHCPGTVAAFGPRFNRQVLGNPDVFHMSLVTGLEGTPLARLGAGMFNTNGVKHKQLRREIAPAFHMKRMEGYHHHLVHLTRQTLDKWHPGQRRDVLTEMEHLIFRSSCQALFGIDGSAEVNTLETLVLEWVKRAYAPAVRLLPIDLPGFPYRRFLRTSRRLDQAIAALLQRPRTEPGEAGSLLAALFRAGKAGSGFLGDSDLIGQTLALLIGAHDTTAAALTWTFFLLSQHPQVLANVVDELAGQLQGQTPALEQLDRLPLLENVVKESLRLLPPVPLAGRVAVEPAPLGPYTLPAGTEVLYSQYVTHHMPELYPQPERFLPERWERIRPSAYEYLPFGAGPRRCLGASLAMSQTKTVLAMVLQRFGLQLLPGARVDRLVRLTLLPRGGMPMIVCEPSQRFTQSKTEVRGNVREMVDLS